MQLSNKKLKYIKRHASQESAEQIAKKLKIPVKIVKKAIRQTHAPTRKTSILSRKATLEKLCFWILAGAAFLIPLLVTDYLYDNVGGVKIILAMMSALVLLAIWLLHGYTTGELKIFKCNLFLPLGCFLAWSLISITWALDGYGGFVQWLHWVACALIFFIALQVLADAKRIRIVLTLIFLSGFLVSVVGILQYLIEIDWFPQAVPPAATFGNRNMAAHFVVLSFPIGVWLFGTAKRSVAVWGASGASASMAIYLFYTHTKAAWVAVGVQVLFLLIFLVFAHVRLKARYSLNLNKRLALGTAMGVVLVMLNMTPQGWQWEIGNATQELAVSVIGIQSDDAPGTELGNRGQSSAAVRFTIWQNTLSIFRDAPFTGVGVANFRSYYPATTITGKRDGQLRLGMQHYHAHNDYIQLMVELGVVFWVLFAWCLCLVLKFMRQLLSPACSAGHRLAGMTVMGGILGLGINALFSFPLYSPVPPVILAIYLAICVRLVPPVADSDDSGQRVYNVVMPKVALTAAIAIMAIFALWISFQVRWVKADRYYKLQSIALLKNDYQKMIHWGEKARLYNPYRKDVRQYLGQGYLLSGEPLKAKTLLMSYQEAFPSDMKNLYHLGQCYQDLKLYTDARQVLEHLVRITPSEGLVHDSLARVYHSLGSGERALEESRAAVKYAPGNSRFFYNYGIMAHKIQRYTETVEALQKAVELDDRMVNAYGLLGLTLFYKLNQPAKGAVYLERALALNIDPARAKKIKAALADYEKSGS